VNDFHQAEDVVQEAFVAALSVDKQGNVWIADFAGNKAGTKGHDT
jgi:hypothetical protein